MPTVFRPPLYVPRPVNETYWEFGQPPRRLNLSLAAAYALPDDQTHQWYPPYEHGSWDGTRSYGYNPNTLVPLQPFTADQRIFNYNEPAVWWQPYYQAQNLSLNVVAKPFSKVWHYDYNDQSLWTGQSDASLTLVPLLTAAGQPPTKNWHYDLDERGALWNWAAPPSSVLKTYLLLPSHSPSNGVTTTMISPYGQVSRIAALSFRSCSLLLDNRIRSSGITTTICPRPGIGRPRPVHYWSPFLRRRHLPSSGATSLTRARPGRPTRT